jgi:excisionase family DNA binding protein
MSERHPFGDVLTLREVAEYLRITDQRAGRLLRDGEIQGRQIGPYWRVPRKNVLAYLDGADVKKAS